VFHRLGRAPPSSTSTGIRPGRDVEEPATVGAPLRLDQIDRLGHARVGGDPGLAQMIEPPEHVVVPPDREGEPGPDRAARLPILDHRAGRLPAKEATLERCVGRYQSRFAGRAIDFTVECGEDGLAAVFPLLPRARLRPVSARRFFTRLKGGDVIFEFVDGPDGRVSGIAVDWSGHAMTCPRLE
jgi:hypothetical protein